MLTSEQVQAIKQRLIEQIDATFPEDRKEFAKNQIEAMDSEQLEKFLIKNNLLQGGNTSQGQCVFCSIVSGDIKSHKIAENKKAVAVLEINPVSRGHIIIIPKEHVVSKEELPKESLALAKKISALIKTRLKPKETKTESVNILGHEIINLIPIYNGTDFSQKVHAAPEELAELREILTKRSPKKKSPAKKSTIKKIIKEFEEKIWLPKRIP